MFKTSSVLVQVLDATFWQNTVSLQIKSLKDYKVKVAILFTLITREKSLMCEKMTSGSMGNTLERTRGEKASLMN
jgi:hypothetical protein